jgi:uncharacterized protein (TIGR02147 family)
MRPPIEILRREYLRRHAKNPGYSLRAFAKLLDVPSGRLSQLFSGKRRLTVQVGRRVSQALGFSAEETQKFLGAIAKQRAAKPDDALAQLAKRQERESVQLSEADEAVVTDPIHFAIIALMETSDFRPDLPWMAARLGSTTVAVRQALDNLKTVSLVDEHKNGALHLIKARNGLVKTRTDISSRALQRAHKKIMAEGVQAMAATNVAQRDMSSMTVAIDPKLIPQAKELIRDFRRKLAVMLESGDQTEVYRLAIQLFPVTQLREQPLPQEDHA